MTTPQRIEPVRSGYNTPAIPSTPPPSLATTSTTSTLTYSRPHLLSLAQTPVENPINPDTLRRISILLRQESTSEWGIDESSSTILDGEPISKSLPIPSNKNNQEKSGQVMFDYTSSPPIPRAAPILIDFKNPFQQNRANPRKASAVFQNFPSSVHTSTSSLTSMIRRHDMEFGPSLKQNLDGRTSRSSSISSSFSSISLGESPPLNPFAAPFPLPETTPRIPFVQPNPPITPPEIPVSLPLPKVASLPQRPPGPIAPVFVRKESAALPQPMSLPSVPPLGHDWEGEKGLSGNEKRRRGSSISVSSSSSLEGDGFNGGPRPERLVKLGQKLRESVAAQGDPRRVKGIKA